MVKAMDPELGPIENKKTKEMAVEACPVKFHRVKEDSMIKKTLKREKNYHIETI